MGYVEITNEESKKIMMEEVNLKCYFVDFRTNSEVPGYVRFYFDTSDIKKSKCTGKAELPSCRKCSAKIEEF
jgi:hypothetical protein